MIHLVIVIDNKEFEKEIILNRSEEKKKKKEEINRVTYLLIWNITHEQLKKNYFPLYPQNRSLKKKKKPKPIYIRIFFSLYNREEIERVIGNIRPKSSKYVNSDEAIDVSSSSLCSTVCPKLRSTCASLTYPRQLCFVNLTHCRNKR